MAAGGTAVALLARPAAGVAATTLPTLPANASAIVSAGIKRFHSRPDLLAPDVVIDHRSAGALGGAIITDSHDGPPQSGPLILDGNGRIVWFNPMDDDPTAATKAFNVSVQKYKGKPVLCWFEGVVTGGHGVGYGQGHYEIVNTRYETVAQVYGQGGLQGDLHEFFLTDEGTAIFSAYGTATTSMQLDGSVQNVPYLYGEVQEVDVATGKLVWSWRSDRHIALSESYAKPVVGPGWIWDYLHLNAISIDPTDGNVLISGRNCSACYKINRRSGRIMWRLGGKHSDFPMTAATRFHYQHDIKIHPDGVLTLFDNEGGPPQYAAHSRALVLSLDERRRRVRLAHQFHHSPQVYSNALGSVQPLDDGDWFVGWGRSTNFTRYSSGGQVLFDGHLSSGSSSYRAFLQPWTGTPTAPPDIDVARSGSAATVYASWNGASSLTQWKVLGGASPSTLAPLGIASVEGFETAISLSSAPAYIAVSALAEGGQVLATSAAVTGS